MSQSVNTFIEIVFCNSLVRQAVKHQLQACSGTTEASAEYPQPSLISGYPPRSTSQYISHFDLVALLSDLPRLIVRKWHILDRWWRKGQWLALGLSPFSCKRLSPLSLELSNSLLFSIKWGMWTHSFKSTPEDVIYLMNDEVENYGYNWISRWKLRYCLVYNWIHLLKVPLKSLCEFPISGFQCLVPHITTVTKLQVALNRCLSTLGCIEKVKYPGKMQFFTGCCEERCSQFREANELVTSWNDDE